MRPRNLDEFLGQEHLVGPGMPLRQAIEADQIPSCIFWGPAGTGKSTLALTIQERTSACFETFSAVTSGVADVRAVVARARKRRSSEGKRTILFVDEIHRFNKAQQDAFLPHVEDGTIVLIGATTENPFFSINSPLLSRSRVYVFEPLQPYHIQTIVSRAMADPERGLGRLKAELTPESMEHLVDVASGDARTALNTLEMAAFLAEPDPEGRRRITLELIQQAVQKRALEYDREEHYAAISAYIKSMRGSDPEAAVYWLARMLRAGEDPRFIARRLVIQAAEDVGNADPMTLVVATAAAQAVEFVGMPEAQIPLAQATIYLATAPKSNASYLAISRAMQDVEQRAAPPVPKHLRDASYPGAGRLGHGKGYLYPHDYHGHFVPQQYLPPGAKERTYYQPSDQGHEIEIARRMEEWKKRIEGEG